MSDKSDTEQIDDIIANAGGGKREVLIELRSAIDYPEGSNVDEAAVAALVAEAVPLNIVGD